MLQKLKEAEELQQQMEVCKMENKSLKEELEAAKQANEDQKTQAEAALARKAEVC